MGLTTKQVAELTLLYETCNSSINDLHAIASKAKSYLHVVNKLADDMADEITKDLTQEINNVIAALTNVIT